MIGDKIKKNQKGFTLMEMVVAAGIFAIVSVVISQLFIMNSRAQRRGGISQKVQSDARVMMNQISDRIRYGTIDYAAYNLFPFTNPLEELNIIDEHGQPVTIRKGTTVCPVNSSPCLEISEDGGPFFAMSSKNFRVNVVQFYLDPIPENDPRSGPPFVGGPTSQPRVSFVLGIQGSARDSDVGTTYVQTTVSSRVNNSITTHRPGFNLARCIASVTWGYPPIITLLALTCSVWILSCTISAGS